MRKHPAFAIFWVFWASEGYLRVVLKDLHPNRFHESSVVIKKIMSSSGHSDLVVFIVSKAIHSFKVSFLLFAVACCLMPFLSIVHFDSLLVDFEPAVAGIAWYLIMLSGLITFTVKSFASYIWFKKRLPERLKYLPAGEAEVGKLEA